LRTRDPHVRECGSDGLSVSQVFEVAMLQGGIGIDARKRARRLRTAVGRPRGARAAMFELAASTLTLSTCAITPCSSTLTLSARALTPRSIDAHAERTRTHPAQHRHSR